MAGGGKVEDDRMVEPKYPLGAANVGFDDGLRHLFNGPYRRIFVFSLAGNGKAYRFILKNETKGDGGCFSPSGGFHRLGSYGGDGEYRRRFGCGSTGRCRSNFLDVDCCVHRYDD